MKPERTIAVEKYAWWNKNVKVSFVSLFKAVTKGLAALSGVGSVPAGVGAAWDLVDGISITDKPEHKAYLLIFNSLRVAIMDLLNDSRLILQDRTSMGYDPVAIQMVADEAESLLNDESFTLSADFFRHPESIKLLADIRPHFEKYLQAVNLSEKEATIMVGRLKAYFVYSLNDAWSRSADSLASIEAEFAVKFPEKNLRNRENYNQKLIQTWQRPILDEPFGLEELYIPLVIESPFKDPVTRTYKRVLVDGFLKKWVFDHHASFDTVVIKGGPGSGKSTLMKWLAKELAEKNTAPVFFIQLNRFNPGEDLLESIPKRAFTGTPLEKYDPFDRDLRGDDQNPILIFDGLDEMSNQGATTQELARSLVSKIQALIEDINYRGWNAKAILTGRDLIIHEVRYLFQERAEILELENMHATFDTREDLCSKFWKNYFQLKGLTFHNLPNIIAHGKLREISAIPILNYFLAKLYITRKEEIENAKSTNDLYRMLVEQVYQREWGREGKKAPRRSTKLTFPMFLEVLQEVGITAWHGGDFRTTTLEAIKERCAGKPIERELKKLYSKNTDEGFMTQLTAFYFKEFEAGDEGVEFMHKSFGEYLAAIGIWGFIEMEVIPFIECNPAEAASNWLGFSGHHVLSENAVTFFSNHPSHLDEATCLAWHSLLANLLSQIIADGFPILKPTDHKTVIRSTRNAMETLLIAISSLADCLFQMPIEEKEPHHYTKIKWSGDMRFPEFHRFLTSFSNTPFAIEYYGHLDLSGARLENIDIKKANFSSCNLENADFADSELKYCNFSNASLLDCGFLNATLEKVDFSRSQMNRARLVSAEISNCDFTKANMKGAFLSQSKLNKANFGGAILLDVPFDGATLSYSTFHQTTLNSLSNFQGATILPAFDQNPSTWKELSVIFNDEIYKGAELSTLFEFLSSDSAEKFFEDRFPPPSPE